MELARFSPVLSSADLNMMSDQWTRKADLFILQSESGEEANPPDVMSGLSVASNLT
jgi:hypothetical protein